MAYAEHYRGLSLLFIFGLYQVPSGNTLGKTYNHGFKSSIHNLTSVIVDGNDPGVRPICPGQETVHVTVDMAIRQLISLYDKKYNRHRGQKMKLKMYTIEKKRDMGNAYCRLSARTHCLICENETLDRSIKDEPSQTVVFNIWMRLGWTDCQLTWEPSDFNGTTSIVLPINRIWRPDITLYNSISVEFYGFNDYKARIYSNGYVAYNFPTKLEVLCPLSVTNFPFDSQVCIFIFGSWILNGYEVDVSAKSSEADLSSMEENVEWVIDEAPAERHVIYYGCCVEPFPDMTYYIHLTRKPDYYIVNIIVPSMLVTLVACLGFFLPADSGEKIGLELTVMLAMSVFQLLIANHLPPSADDTPWISKFFTFTLILSGGASCWQVIVLNIHHRGERPMPKCLKSCFLKPISVVTCVPLTTDKAYIQHECKTSDFNQNGKYTDKKTESPLSAQGSETAMNDSELWIQFALMLDRIGFVVFALSLTIGCVYIFMGIKA